MNKQELKNEIIKLSKERYDSADETRGLQNAIETILRWVNKLDEPKECEILAVERNEYVTDYCCSQCKKFYDLFRFRKLCSESVNFCPNCGAKIIKKP